MPQGNNTHHEWKSMAHGGGWTVIASYGWNMSALGEGQGMGWLSPESNPLFHGCQELREVMREQRSQRKPPRLRPRHSGPFGPPSFERWNPDRVPNCLFSLRPLPTVDCLPVWNEIICQTPAADHSFLVGTFIMMLQCAWRIFTITRVKMIKMLFFFLFQKFSSHPSDRGGIGHRLCRRSRLRRRHGILVINKTASREPQGVGSGWRTLQSFVKSLGVWEAGSLGCESLSESAEDGLASRTAPCLIMYQEARKGVGLSFQFRGRERRKKRCGVSRLRNEQADLFRVSERKNQMYSSRVTMTEGSHCALT